MGKRVAAADQPTMKVAGLFLVLCTSFAGSMFVQDDTPVMSMAMSALEAASQVMQAPRKRAGVRGDMSITGNMVCSNLASPTGNVTLLGDLCCKGMATVKEIVTAHLKTSSMKVTKIVTSRGVVAVKGKIQVSGAVAGLMNSTCDNMEIGGTKQAAMSFLETFEDSNHGWSGAAVTDCNGNKILGGHCSKSKGEVTKTYTDLPEHSHLELNANFLFLDSWEGESAYAKIDNSFLWLDSYDSRKVAGAKNVCGGDCPEGRLSQSIRASVPHTGSTATVTFGSTLNEDACDESFGVDNVMLKVR